ncbi:DNA-binding protein [Metabacillus fastidiosus]|uniref:DNA-binding protein n=2 Tax=Metabacillus fastidiosus TaxID=1458 RepID=A0ABU6P319_9BACI|nr:DNA-binding protein [Metabacillus fastidiosus]MED4402551.1 DNA-binding protein [Metabacillus fastidiosus]
MHEKGEINMERKMESDLPEKLVKPALRALTGAGYIRLDQFTELTESDVLQLHGMGPKALDQIRQALSARGLSFAEKS